MPVRGWTSKSGSCLRLEVTAGHPSRRPFRGLGKGQAAKVVRSFRCLAARCEECAFVGLQELNPRADIASISDVTIKAKFRTQERGAQLCDQLFASVIPRAKAVPQVSIKARLKRY